MSTLRQALDLRRASESESDHLCYSVQAQTPCLVVLGGDGVRWIMPWMHFINGQHQPHDGLELFTLTFVSHVVIIEGRQLGLLAEEAAKLRLAKICEMPQDYRDATEQPFIEKIVVRVSDAQSAEPDKPGITT